MSLELMFFNSKFVNIRYSRTIEIIPTGQIFVAFHFNYFLLVNQPVALAIFLSYINYVGTVKETDL